MHGYTRNFSALKNPSYFRAYFRLFLGKYQTNPIKRGNVMHIPVVAFAPHITAELPYLPFDWGSPAIDRGDP